PPASKGGRMRLLEASDGCAALAEIDGQVISTTAIEYRCLQLLLSRTAASTRMDDEVGGDFVASAELLAKLPWGCPYPEHNHLKKLVRRLRERLSTTRLRIEGRHGLGYRVCLARPAGPVCAGATDELVAAATSGTAHVEGSEIAFRMEDQTLQGLSPLRL